MIKLVVFDLDGTLVNTFSAVKKAREENITHQILKEKGYQVEQQELEEALENVEQKVNDYKGPERFKPGFPQIVLGDELDKNISEEEAAEIESELLEEVLKNLKLIPEAEEILQYLKEKEIDVYLLSNSPKEVMEKKINKFDLEKYFDKTFSSQSVGAVKSSYVPFEKLLEKTEHSPGEILMVGNDTSEDALANEFGMNTAILIDYLETNPNDEQFEPDYQLSSLMDVKKIIKNHQKN